jgi:hypothetical protein
MRLLATSDGFGPDGQTNAGLQGSGDVSRFRSPPVTEVNPTHRQFLHPHTLLDLGRDPPDRSAGLRPRLLPSRKRSALTRGRKGGNLSCIEEMCSWRLLRSCGRGLVNERHVSSIGAKEVS